MNFSNIKTSAATLLDILPVLFLAIVFLQSSLDKLIDRTGNTAYIRGVMAKTPLAGFWQPLFWVLTAMEFTTGVLCALGFLQIALGGGRNIAFYGVALAGFTFLALLLGQRLAKDYAGAAALVPYFLVALVGISTLG